VKKYIPVLVRIDSHDFPIDPGQEATITRRPEDTMRVDSVVVLDECAQHFHVNDIKLGNISIFSPSEGTQDGVPGVNLREIHGYRIARPRVIQPWQDVVFSVRNTSDAPRIFKALVRGTADHGSHARRVRCTARRTASMTLAITVLDIQPHPDHATHNPNTWGVKVRVELGKRRKTFWRWMRSESKPTVEDATAEQWLTAYYEAHGFHDEALEAMGRRA
jgi:hypothetical protein